jgi:hypothetical protein
MIQRIGQRELALRAQREQAQKEERARESADKVRADLAAKLPATSGVKPVRRKAKRRAKP